jgi:MFS family permease
MKHHVGKVKRSMDFNERKIIVLTCYCHFLSHFYMLIFPSLVMPLTTYFQMSIPDVLSLGFLMYLLFGVGALPMGIATDLWNGKRMLTLYLLGIGVFSLMAGISKQANFLMINLAIIGLFASIYHPAGMGLISKGCKRRGYALGLNGVYGNLGLGLAPLVTGIVTYRFGWQAIYLVTGAIVIISGVLMFFVGIDETPVQTEAAEPGPGTRRYILYFAILCVCMMMAGFSSQGTAVVIPAYFEQVAPFFNRIIDSLPFIRLTGTKTLAATMLTSFVYFFGIFGQLAGGRLADRIDLRVGYIAFHSMSLPFMVLMTQFTNIPLFAFTMTHMFFAWGMQPMENSLVARLTPEKLRATSYGFKFISTFGVGSLSVITAKYLIRHYGFVYVFWFQSAVIVLLVLTISLLVFLTRKESFRN